MLQDFIFGVLWIIAIGMLGAAIYDSLYGKDD